MLAGATSTSPCCTIVSARVARPTTVSLSDGSISSGSYPRENVRHPCGSRSTTSTARSSSAMAAAMLRAVVVLPTPPFWFATAYTVAVTSRPSPGVKPYRAPCSSPDRDHTT
jgi:hypothetical protein